MRLGIPKFMVTKKFLRESLSDQWIKRMITGLLCSKLCPIAPLPSPTHYDLSKTVQREHSFLRPTPYQELRRVPPKGVGGV